MLNPTVALTRCTDYSLKNVAASIQRQFELLGGLEKFVRYGDSVLLKPNFIAPRSRRHATQTDSAILIETAKLLKDFGAKPFIADSPAWGNIFACVKALEMEEPLKKLGVPVRQLDKPKICRIGPDNAKVGISSVALDADVIINMPKFKSHQQLVATFAVKNMFGCVTGKKKAYWHFAKGKNHQQFCRLLIGIFKFLNPVLTIIDGVIAMDGPGPIRGTTKNLGWIIAGAEPISCEIVCSKLINMDPNQLPIVRTAQKIDFGCWDLDKIKIAGDAPEQAICKDFIDAELIPIRFSLIHVCKSICKQILLLAKTKIKKAENG